MIVTIEVKRSKTENNLSLLRRFNKRLQETGLMRMAKARRFSFRPPSVLARKVHALKRLARRKEIERLKKLGKIA